MEILGSGLLTLFNGFVAMVSAFASPVAVAALLGALALAWLCRVEIDELNRSSSKPEIGRH